MSMISVDKLMLARVVQFSETRYNRGGIFLEFLHDELRPIVLLDGLAVDIFNHQIYDIVYMEDGVIPMEDLATLDRRNLYVYTIYSAEFPEENVDDLRSRTEETIQWYYQEQKNQDGSGDKKVISFEFRKRKLKTKGRNSK